ncbi:MAG: ATP-binding protein [Clostridia bacterium]|nr:ATP-binding protein [Clostridia bacterium]
MKFEIRSDLYKREKYLDKIRGFYHECEVIKVLTGVRRCGKSSIMNLIAGELLESGVKDDNILYFNLDKKPYDTVTSAEELDSLISENSRAGGIKYLFIDEIQNVEGFERVINSWREERNFSIFITGSNSYLLSGDLVTKLTGRYIEFNILPLSFEEYIGFKKFFGKSISEDNMAELRSYIREGGFPYVVRLNSLNDKRTYVQSLIDEIYEKDVKRRIKIRNRAAFDAVMRYIVNNFGATTSIQNIVDDFAKIGTIIKKETVNRYISALCSAKIIIPCERFDMKSRRSLAGEKKYYLSDLSFYYAFNADNRINFGPVLENIVYTYAASRDYTISVGRIGKFECDFILRDNEMNYSYVQVAYTILDSRETEDREYRALEGITVDNYPKYLLTTDSLLQKRNGIIHANLIDFIKEGRTF